MIFKDRDSLVTWLNGHAGKRICLKGRGSTLKITGRTRGVEKLDACSAEFMECELETGHPEIQVALSLHPQSLALHLIVSAPDEGETVCSLPLSLSYGEVDFSPHEDKPRRTATALSATALPGTAISAGEREKEEPEYSPYELLFPRSD